MKSILFVDDEAFVLNSIRRMMRKERNRWEAHFANGGNEALDVLKQRRFDLLITDMKMPLIDGMEVLGAAEAMWPDMPRIALSGYSEKETQARATNLVFKFLDKPCESVELKATIEDVLG